MKQTGLMFFVKYPYATAIITTVRIASGAMVINSETLAALPVITINMVLSWILMAISLGTPSK